MRNPRLSKKKGEFGAQAEEDYHFVEWTGAVGTIADVNAASISITVNDNYFITANFW